MDMFPILSVFKKKGPTCLKILLLLIFFGFMTTVVLHYSKSQDYLQDQYQRYIKRINIFTTELENASLGWRFESTELTTVFKTTTRRSAEPVQHIAFIKIHKCGSSTAQNVFLRFGYERNLTFLLSRIRETMPYSNVISFDETLNDDNVELPPANKSYDIVCFHVFYNKRAFEKYMPSDTKYISIIRDPFEMFLSIIRYFRPMGILAYMKYNYTDPLSQFLRYGPFKQHRFFLGDNPIAVELGASKELTKTYNASGTREFIAKLDKDFEVVIINEHFEESMVLMRRRLGWNTKDILYTDLNVSDKKKFNITVKSAHRELLYKRAFVDVEIYRHFYHKLWTQINQEGDDFFKELLEYKRLRKKVSVFCSRREFKTEKLIVPDSPWCEAFLIAQQDCSLLHKQEMDFTKMIRKRQYNSL